MMNPLRKIEAAARNWLNGRHNTRSQAAMNRRTSELSPEVRDGTEIWKQIMTATATGKTVAEERLDGRAWRMLIDCGEFLVARYEDLPVAAWHVLIQQPDPLGDAPGDMSCPAEWKRGRTVVFLYIVMPHGHTPSVSINRPGKWRNALDAAVARTHQIWQDESRDFERRREQSYKPVDDTEAAP